MRIYDNKAIQNFMFAGRAVFTLKSTRTGTRFTYKLCRKKDEPEVFYLHVLVAPDLYKFTGVVAKVPTYTYKGFSYNHSFKKGQLQFKAPSVQAFDWFLRHVQESNIIHPKLEFWHEGKCGKCGRALTVPESIATGLGPDCAAAAGVRWAA